MLDQRSKVLPPRPETTPFRMVESVHEAATLFLMARRRDRRRRDARRDRVVEARTVHAPEPFDRAKAISKWNQKLGTMTARGFVTPPFAALVFGLDLIENRSSRR